MRARARPLVKRWRTHRAVLLPVLGDVDHEEQKQGDREHAGELHGFFRAGFYTSGADITLVVVRDTGLFSFMNPCFEFPKS